MIKSICCRSRHLFDPYYIPQNNTWNYCELVGEDQIHWITPIPYKSIKEIKEARRLERIQAVIKDVDSLNPIIIEKYGRDNIIKEMIESRRLNILDAS